MSIIIFIITITVFLYAIFVLSRDDYLLIRKNISQETMFSLGLFCMLLCIFFARVVFALERHHSAYLNPLVFFAFSYYPGLSVFGGILGFVAGLFLFAKRQKLPLGRITDILSIAVLYTLGLEQICSFFGYLFMRSVHWNMLIMSISTSVVWGIVLWLWQKNKIASGNGGYLAVCAISGIYILGGVFSHFVTHAAFGIDTYLLGGMFVITMLLYFFGRRFILSHD